jgi:anti-sigma factor RsiW
VNYDEEILIAYADGELDAARAAKISAAIERDPALARRVEQHRALRAQIAGAYSPVLEQPVPERLLAAARGATAADAVNHPQRSANVLQFPARAAAPSAVHWRGREWAAMAASLVLGVLLAWKFFAPAEPAWMSAHQGALVARGDLARALDTQLASTQRAADAVQIGLTFKARDGGYCRSFVLPRAGTAGLACREQGEWRIPVTAAAQVPAEGLKPAATLPAPVLAAVEARISGEALDADGEQRARLGGWDAKRE